MTQENPVVTSESASDFPVGSMASAGWEHRSGAELGLAAGISSTLRFALVKFLALKNRHFRCHGLLFRC